jgi:hypothetical protein
MKFAAIDFETADYWRDSASPSMRRFAVLSHRHDETID